MSATKHHTDTQQIFAQLRSERKTSANICSQLHSFAVCARLCSLRSFVLFALIYLPRAVLFICPLVFSIYNIQDIVLKVWPFGKGFRFQILQNSVIFLLEIGGQLPIPIFVAHCATDE